MSRRSAALLTLLAAIALAGCESTEQESAKIAKRLGHQRASAAVTKIKGANSSVRIVSAQIVSSAGGTAAVGAVDHRLRRSRQGGVQQLDGR